MIQVVKMKKIFFTALAIALFGCKNNDDNGNEPPPPLPRSPDTFNCIIQKSYPHDTSSFTEGFLVYNGAMYESAGNYDESKLMRVNMSTWKPELQIKLDSNYFGEGISILHDTIYQLTYKEHTVFVYALKDFKKIKELPFNTDSGQGWGMTTDGTYLIASDGTNNLYYFEPSTFKLVKKLPVTDAGTPSYNVNELEYIDGYIYSNQWQLPYVLKIDPSNGVVVAKADLTDIWNRVKQKDTEADVPNGIAYDPATKKIYITGKKWPELYEVQFNQ